jgi:hypothetical protein
MSILNTRLRHGICETRFVDQVDGNDAVLSQAGMNETYQIVYNRLIQIWCVGLVRYTE